MSQPDISRSTLKEDGGVPDLIGHPRAPGETRDEIELFIRDAYAAGCNAARSRSLVLAIEYAAREAPKLRAILASQPPRAVSENAPPPADPITPEWCMETFYRVNPGASDTMPHGIPSLYLLDFAREVIDEFARGDSSRTTT